MKSQEYQELQCPLYILEVLVVLVVLEVQEALVDLVVQESLHCVPQRKSTLSQSFLVSLEHLDNLAGLVHL